MTAGDARTAVADLVFAYAEHLDAGDLDGAADLFADAEMVTGDVVRRGRDEVRAMWAPVRLDEHGSPRTKHVTTNLRIDVDEDAGTATCRSYFTVLQAVPGALALQPIVAGRYHDRFERVAGAWRFAGRRIVPELVGDLSQHLAGDIGLAEPSVAGTRPGAVPLPIPAGSTSVAGNDRLSSPSGCRSSDIHGDR